MMPFLKTAAVYLVAVNLLLTAYEAAAAESGLVVHGALQCDAIGWYRDDRDLDSAFSFAGRNMLTVNVKTGKLRYAKVEGLVDIYQLYGAYAEQFEKQFPTSGEQLATLFGGTPLLIDLRMFYGSLYLPWADISFGRQIVNYGKGLLFSPLDVFSTVDLFELSFKRSGSDIAMVSIPIGDVSGIDMVTEFPPGKDDYASSLRAFTTVAGWDLSTVGIYRHRRREVIGGVAFKGDCVVGVTGELVTHYRRDEHEWQCNAMAGVDYSIRKTVVFGAEYLYQSKNETLTMYDRHNIYGSVQYIINDLMNLSAVAIGSLPSEHLIGILQYSWNILQSVNTIFYLRYYRFDDLQLPLPWGEAGMRVEIRF